MRVLIADDEPVAVERLELALACIPEAELVGVARTGKEALALIRELQPDVAILDIQMPGQSGFGVLAGLRPSDKMPEVIFVTAYESHAVKAFEICAVDYLLKPVTPEGLARAVARAREKIGAPENRVPDPSPQSEWIEEFWVPYRSEMVRIAAIDIDRIDAMRDYMSLQIGSRNFLLHQTLGTLERRLDPARFIRVHRSTIVRRDFIAKLRHDGLGIWYAILVDGTDVRIGRSYLTAVKALAGR